MQTGTISSVPNILCHSEHLGKQSPLQCGDLFQAGPMCTPKDTSQLVSPASYDPGLPPREHATSGGGTRGPCVDSAPSQYCCRDPMSTYFMGPGGGHLKGTHRNLCLLSWKRVPTMGTEESYPTYKCPQISKVISTGLCPIWAAFYLFLIFSFWPGLSACRILVPQPGIKPRPQQWKLRLGVLTTGPPGKSPGIPLRS